MVGPIQVAEPLLDENPDRFCMFPIKYREVWEMYKKAEASFWTGERAHMPVSLSTNLRRVPRQLFALVPSCAIAVLPNMGCPVLLSEHHWEGPNKSTGELICGKICVRPLVNTSPRNNAALHRSGRSGLERRHCGLGHAQR